MSTLASKFIRRFERCFSLSWVIRDDKTGQKIVVVPCSDAKVGDIKVIFDCDEITVCIGDHTHRHFNPTIDYQAKWGNEAEELSIRDAIQYIAKVVNREVLFVLRYKGGTLIGSTSSYGDNVAATAYVSKRSLRDRLFKRNVEEYQLRWPNASGD